MNALKTLKTVYQHLFVTPVHLYLIKLLTNLRTYLHAVSVGKSVIIVLNANNYLHLWLRDELAQLHEKYKTSATRKKNTTIMKIMVMREIFLYLMITRKIIN